MIKIALIGPHNSGKTTSLYYLCYKLKGIGEELGIGQEIARECPYPLNEAGGSVTQFWILFKQIEKETNLEKWYKKIILDRSVFDEVAYSLHLASKGLMLEEEAKFVKEVAFSWARIHPYSLLIYHEPLSLESDLARGSNTSEYQEAITKRFKGLIKELPVRVEVVKCATKERRCKQVLRLVEEEFQEAR